MERTTCTLIYYLRKTRIDKEGKAPIYVRLTVNGQRAEICARARILLRYWNQSRGKAVENNREGREINRLLEAISFNIAQTRRTLEAEGKEITATGIMNRYLGKDLPERHTLMEVFREHNKRCRALIGIDFTASTVQRYESLMRITGEFLLKEYGSEDLYLDELPVHLVEDYEFYMKTERRCVHNTVMKNLKNFKKIIRIAQSNGWVPMDPFHGKHIHMESVDRPFLEKQEFLSWLHKEISIPRLAQVRDIFCFCCLTGLAFTDVQQLKAEHLVADIHGKIWIRKARQKTKNMCNIPLAKNYRPLQGTPLLPDARRAASRMQQPEDELLLEGAGRHLRHPQKSVDSHGKTSTLEIPAEYKVFTQLNHSTGNDLETSNIL